MQQKIEITYGSEECEEFMAIVLEKGLPCASIQTEDGIAVATIKHSTNTLFLESGITRPIEHGESLFLVYDRIRLMSHMSALAQLAHLLFHRQALG